MEDLFVGIRNFETAVVDFDQKIITFMRDSQLISLKSMSFGDCIKLARTISKTSNNHEFKTTYKKKPVNSIKGKLPIVEITDKGFKYLTIDIFELKAITHTQECDYCGIMLFKNIKYIGAIDKMLCDKCFIKWDKKVSVGGDYKWSEFESKHLQSALKNISKQI